VIRLVSKQAIIFLALLVLAGCHAKRAESPSPAAHEVVERSPEKIYVPEFGVADPVYKDRLLRGFYDGTQGWKWTAQTFAVALDPPEGSQRTVLSLDFAVPVELMKDAKSVTLSAKVNGTNLGSTEYRTTGRFNFYREVPAKALQRKPVEVEFSVDKVWKDAQGQAKGVIAVGVGLVAPEANKADREYQLKMAHAGYQALLRRRDLKLSVEKQHEMMKLFHDVPVWQHMFFHSIQIEKNPLDLWMMQQIIYEVRPDFIVETGTWRGGSATYWAHTLNGMGLEASRVITVDMQDLAQTASQHPLWKKYVTFLKGSSTDKEIVSKIAQTVKGRKVLVVLDSDHSMRHVLDELHAYAPMVPRGSYLIVEDTHIDGVPTQPEEGPGPLAAVRKFLSEPAGAGFRQDLTREALIMTFNPGGWLRRD